MPKPIVLTKDWRQWLWQIEKHKLTLADLDDRTRGLGDAHEYRQAFERAVRIVGQMTVAPATPMNYSTQLIVLLAMDLEGSALLLQEKRDTAGDAGKSYVLYAAEGKTRLHPTPPPEEPLRLDAGSRVYVVCHGNPGSTVAMRSGLAGPTENWDPSKLATFLRAILRHFQADRVKRISLFMCFSGGNPDGRDPDGGPTPVPKVGGAESYAARLYELLKDVTDEVAGRAESVRMYTQLFGYASDPADRNVGIRKLTGPDRQHKGRGRKIVFSAQSAASTQTTRSYEW